MKKLGIILFAVIIMAGCTSTGGGAGGQAGLEPPPPGTERITLENGAYAIFRFDLPAGATWANYNKLTAEYMVDEVNLKKKQRNDNNVRLMGNYNEDHLPASGRERVANLQNFNGPYILDNTPRTFASMGAVADEWFTVEYNITGSTAHAQFVDANIPAANAAGPFFFGIGIPSMFEGRRNGITQLIRNVTLHHATDPSLNVVSKGSGFEESAFASFWPVFSTREMGADE